MQTIKQHQTTVTQDICGSYLNSIPKVTEKATEIDPRNSQIEQLSAATLNQAVALIKETFAIQENENPELELAESVNPGRYTAQLEKHGIIAPYYWVVTNHGNVLGVSGYYSKTEDQDEAVWGGWTVYSETLRTGLSGMKMKMVYNMMIEAYASGRKFFRLYTSTAPVEAQANRLYEKVGIRVYKTEPTPDGEHMILYRQAEFAELLKVNDYIKANVYKDGFDAANI